MARTSRILMSAAILAMGFLVDAAIAQAPTPVIGTWVLNVAKSKYDPGPPLKSQTRTYLAVPGGFRFTSDAVNSAGEKIHVEFTAVFDRKYHALTGSPTADSIMVKQVGTNTVESTQKKGTNVVQISQRTVSKDGKTLTVESRGTNADGKPFTNVEIFDKK
jgi:hypothetical protein